MSDPLRFSKTVRNGMLLTRRQGKYIKYSGKGRFVGVYQSGGVQQVITDEGLKVSILPRGIVIGGSTPALMTTAPAFGRRPRRCSPTSRARPGRARPSR